MIYEKRLALACDAAVAIYKERGNFISDSDVLELADQFTVSDMSWASDDSIDPLDPSIDTTDRDALIRDLYEWLTPDPDPEVVWVVEQYVDYEGGGVAGVFSSRQAAEDAIAKQYSSYIQGEPGYYTHVSDEFSHLHLHELKVDSWAY